MDDEAIGQLLRDCGLLTTDTFDDDTELALDSLTLVWLAHLLDEQHGIVVSIEDEDGLASCTSVWALRRFLTQRADGEPAFPEVLHGS
jgi:acyl carrier protein